MSDVNKSSRRASKAVTLTLLAATAGATAGCQEKPTHMYAYASEDACRISAVFSARQCKNAWDRAEEERMATAPRYADIASCQVSFNTTMTRCEEDRNNPGLYMPASAGFVVGTHHYRFMSRVEGRILYYAAEGALRTLDNYLSVSSTGGYGYVRTDKNIWRANPPARPGMDFAYSARAQTPARAAQTSGITSSASASTYRAAPSNVTRGGFGSSAGGYSVAS